MTKSSARPQIKGLKDQKTSYNKYGKVEYLV